MKAWFNRLTPNRSSGPESPANSSPIRDVGSPSLTAAFASDPTQWETNFDKFWLRTEQILDKKIHYPEHEVVYEEMTQLLSQLARMCELLMMEVNAQPEPAIGPILDRYFTQQILERCLDWAIQIPDFLKPTCQLSLIRIYEGIVSESHTQNHCLLVHKPILNPLLRLFEWCKRAEGRRRGPNQQVGPSSTDKHFVLLLNQICTKLAEDRTLLHFFFTCSQGSDQFIVFSLLIPFLYEQNDVGQLARDALLLILSVSFNHEEIANFVAYKSAFCPVVATGLSGCFSQLSRVLSWEFNDRGLSDASSDSLFNFHSSLLFCNAVVQAAHPSVVQQICSFFYSGFLISVVKPALLQEERDGVTACTAYLQICIETVSEKALIQTIVRMLLVEKDDDNRPLIQTILLRTRGNDKLAIVSLALTDCLLQLGCEDIMLVLVFGHMLSLRHVSRSQLTRVRDRIQTSLTAQKILECVPDCMLRFPAISSQDTLAVYLREGAELVEKRVISCSSWKWRYDGISPSPLLFSPYSDEDSNHLPFSRLSSCRSSMSSAAAFGLNRYFSSRHNHLTAESTMGRLAELGGSPLLSSDDGESPLEEDEEFILPPINTSTMMTSSMMDYFQLSAFDDLSEEDMPNSAHTNEASFDDRKKLQKEETVSLPSETESARGFDTDMEMARSFVLTGWAELEDMDTFISLLDRRTLLKKHKVAPNETMAFIDSKLQYMKELKDEEEMKDVKEPEKEKEEEKTEVVKGLPIDGSAESSILLDNLLYQLERMCDHPIALNLQLANVISSIASYPQPVLVAYLFDTERNDRYPQLIETLSKLKKRVDSQVAGVNGTEVLVARTLRTLEGRADRMERHNDASWRGWDSPRDESISSLLKGRQFGGSGRRPHGYRFHSHKAVESEEIVRDDTAARNVVQAAMVLTNLCQMLAGIALHQSLVVLPYPLTEKHR